MVSLTKDLEHHLEKKCTHYAHARGWETLKCDMVNRSWPDQAFFKAGRVIFVEFKRPGEKPRAQQEARIDLLRAQLFEVHVIDNYDDFKHVVETYK